ncbi:DUF898 domain-containing protein [Halosquirtibacter xylanolyticus]|uniref:DUF898 family protein n=1 Tax=Halosquirtibacter xylanolyticus TaxID=3374599 RepID=UPI0037497391|nr:DUF898 domain-containing protein [Prolixibacteraceae bacterium]
MKKNLTANISLRNCILPMILAIIIIIYIYTPPIIPISNIYLSTSLGQLTRIISWLSLSFLSFKMVKGILEGIMIDNEVLEFHGILKDYLKIALIYSVITIITLGLAFPLFLKKKYEYLVANTTYKGQPLQFRGCIKAMTIFISVIMCSIYAFLAIAMLDINIPFSFDLSGDAQFAIFYLLLISFVIISTAYLYHWYARFNYKDYKLGFKNHFTSYIPYLLLSFVGSILTLGLGSIFFSLWVKKIYIKDFEAKSEEQLITFSEEIDIFNDGFYILGQMLLIIITIGIYTPIAYQKILNRIIPKIAYTKES